MIIANEGIEISNRFFYAIDILKANKKMRGLKTFTDTYDINRRNLQKVKRDPATHVLKPEWLVPLVKDYNISGDWLLTGIGKMFKN